MSTIHQSIRQITALEELSHKDTPVHRLAPLVKLMITIVYIIIVISYRPLALNGLILYAAFPVFLMIIGEVPLRPLLARCLIALPFAMFAGISNLILSRGIVLYIGEIGITEGVVTFLSLLIKTLLTVMAVLILISTTAMNDLIYALLSVHVPSILIIQFMMTYRYLGLLGEEASLMYHAYRLRAPKEKGIKLKDIGPFLGQLILRSFDRADRIYHAMQCRGFEGRLIFTKKRSFRSIDWMIMFGVIVIMVMLRFIRIGE